MKKILIAALCFFTFNSQSQIISPDTVCVGIPVNFSTPKWAVTYTWDFNSINVNQPLSPVTALYTGAPLNNPASGVLVMDSGNFYYFAVNYGTEEVIKFNFGSNIHNTPIVTNLGPLGMSGGDLDGIDIVKDSATNQWYGLLADYSMIGVLSFGTSPNNTPSCTTTSFSAPTVAWGHQLKIKRYNGNWTAFLANRNSNMTRFDFGSSLTNPPITHVLPNLAGLVNPDDFTLYEEGGNWYALICNLIAATLIRYDFGPNLLNNAPTAVSLGNPGGFLNLPRPIHLLNDCENHLIGYLANENGTLIKLDFAGSITNTPTATNLGPTGVSHFAFESPDSYSDTLIYIVVDANLNQLWTYSPVLYSLPAFTNYYTPNENYTFTSPGIYHVSLFCDQGYTSGPSVFCKDIVVTNGTGTTSSRDTAICTSPPITLHADTIGRYLWNTGDTTSSIAVYGTGTYWNSVTTGLCTYKVDTTHVTFISGLSFSLGNDTALCPGGQITLAPVIPAGVPYAWSTGAATRSITVDSPGTYWLTLGSDGCLIADTIHIAENPDPVVDLGPDQSACAGTPVTLQSSVAYVSPSYLWSTGSTAPSVSVSTSGSYWLHVTVKGCTGADTVNVNFNPVPDVSLGNDTTICPGNKLSLGAQEPQGAQYLWSNGATDSSIAISDGGVYTLTVKLNGCTATDSITITEGALDTVNLGPDTTACIGGAVQLTVSSSSAIWSNDHEGPSIAVSNPGTYWVKVKEQCGVVSDTINVDFHICDIGFPSAFTPNGDGLNEIIGVVGTLKYYSNFSLSIYNRWGQRVFYSEDIYSGWDGTFNGIKQDMGTYFYMIDYTLEGKKHMMKGDFQLIR